MHVRCPHCENAILVVPAQSLESISCPTCGSNFSLLDSTSETRTYTHISKLIGRFEMLERLGAGSYGTVWKARDSDLKRLVAIKVPHRSAITAAAADLFFREARAAARLRHPGVVAVYEVGREEDSVYMVSEYIEGLDLSDWLQQYPPTPRRAAELVATLADALQHAHAAGIIHRDLKPTNVLMDIEGQPHLTDFGLAKQQGAEATIAVDGQPLGTPAYMSPEQARGDGHLADARTDVYALGVMLYEMLTGKRPFVGGKRLLLHQIIHEDAVSPRKYNRQVPKDLAQICLKALEKNPKSRYQSAGEMSEDLQRFLGGKPALARPVPPWERGRRWAVRNPAWATASVLGLIALAACGIAYGAALRPAAGSIAVQVVTQPAGVHVLCWQLDPKTRQPVAQFSSSPGWQFWRRTPSVIYLPPADYLVIAHQDEHTFHEVFRRVPADIQAVPGYYPHLRWEVADDGIVWPTITLHRSSALAADMVGVSGGVLSARELATRTQDVTIPGLLVDPREITLAQVKKSGAALMLGSESTGQFGLPSPIAPATNLNWDASVAVLEAMGRRLPTRAIATYLSQQPAAQPDGAIKDLLGRNREWLADATDPVFRLTLGNKGEPTFIGQVGPVGAPDLGLRGVRRQKFSVEAPLLP